MVDSLVEMLVETSDLSIFWYVEIFLKSKLEMFYYEAAWLFFVSSYLKIAQYQVLNHKWNNRLL